MIGKDSPADLRVPRSAMNRWEATGSLRRLRRRVSAFSLIEIMMAMLILGLAVLPVIQVFSKTYYTASRQYEEALALKIAEAIMNKASAWKFKDLEAPPGSYTLPVQVYLPADHSLPAAKFTGALGMNGTPACGRGEIKYKSTTYKMRLDTEILYSGPPDGGSAMVFSFTSPLASPGTTVVDVATYACPDTFLKMAVTVEYGKLGKKLHLISFRANLTE